MRITLSFAALLLLTACVNGGQDFCRGNYPEGSMAFNQCVAQYQQQPAFYSYCTRERGIVQDGAALHQCLQQEAPGVLAERERIREIERQQRAYEDAVRRDDEARWQREEAWRQHRSRNNHDRDHRNDRNESRDSRSNERTREGKNYTDIAYGDVLECSLHNGRVFTQDWKPYREVSFAIARDEKKQLQITANNGEKISLKAHYGAKGNAISLCGVDNQHCTTVNGVAALFKNPRITSTVSVKALLQNATLECNFAQATAKPQNRDSRTSRNKR